MGRWAICLCAAVMATAAAAAGADAPPANAIPIADFVRPDEFGTMKLSPDGQSLAMTTGRNGRAAVVFFSLKDQQITGGVRVPDPYEIYDFYWVSPTRAIYMLAERFVGQGKPSFTGEIYAVDRDGASHRAIYGYRVGEKTIGTKIPKKESSYATPVLISTLDEDREEILIAEHRWIRTAGWWYMDRDARPDIVRLNVYTGAKKSLGPVPLRNADVMVDHADRVRFAIGRNAQYQPAVSWRPEPDAPWTDFDLPGFRPDSLQPGAFSGDNASVLFTGVRQGETLRALYQLDLRTHDVQKLQGFARTDVDGMVTDFASHDVIGVLSEAERPQHLWLDGTNAATKLYLALEKAFPGQTITITSTSDDGGRALAYVRSDTNPGDFYLFDTATRKADYLRSTRAWVDPSRMRPKEPIQLTARDGLQLHGYLTMPAGDGPHPMVVLPQRAPSQAREVWEYDWEVQLLASRGYSVLQVNQRGSSGYGLDFENAGRRQWGGRMQDDITDATRWAIEHEHARADRICIFGSGWYGGYAAVMGSVREPGLYRCTIAVGGAYDLNLLFDDSAAPDSKSERAYLESWVGNDKGQLQAASPVHNAQRIDTSLLLIHGKVDNFVNFEHAKRLKRALEQHDKKFEWLPLSGEGWQIYDAGNRQRVYERVLAFLDTHLHPNE